MAEKVSISEDWLADRAALHDAKVLFASLDENVLTIRIDDEWPNLSRSYDDAAHSGGWLTFEEAEIIEGNIEDVSGRFVSELKSVGNQWVLHLARPSLISRRGRLVFSAETASFIPDS
jgi:hypothetical protein